MQLARKVSRSWLFSSSDDMVDSGPVTITINGVVTAIPTAGVTSFLRARWLCFHSEAVNLRIQGGIISGGGKLRWKDGKRWVEVDHCRVAS